MAGIWQESTQSGINIIMNHAVGETVTQGYNEIGGRVMKYYVTADIHGFLSLFQEALKESGYYEDNSEKKIIVCGDLFDRGEEAEKLQDYILSLMEKDEVILVKGNHEDCFCDLITVDNGAALTHHLHNGTYETALQLTGYDLAMA